MNDSEGLNRRAVLAGGGVIAAGALGLAAARSSALPATPKTAPDFGKLIPVAFVMGPGSTMIDFAGPWEVFQDASNDEGQGFYLYTVSDSTDEIMTTGNFVNDKGSGLRFRPDYAFADAPQPRVIMMGAQGGHTPAKIDWIRKASEKADFVLSVCTGAFLLGETGLLDGLEATTHHQFFDSFEKKFPKVKLIRDARYVDNGKVVTAGGLTSGIDGALHIVERMLGRPGVEQTIAYMEYSGDGWRTRARA